jgi:uncharacterized protein YjdB
MKIQNKHFTVAIKILALWVVIISGILSMVACGGSSSGSKTPPTVPVPVTLTQISIEPAAVNGEIPPGEKGQFKATGNYSNGSTQDLTESVTWVSTNAAFATVSNDAGEKGVGTTVAEGTAQIYAILDSVESTRVTINVSPDTETLVRIIVEPMTEGPGHVGRTKKFKAVAHYSNNASYTVTEVVTWASTETGIATIDSSGVATGMAEGSTDITAQSPDGSMISNPAALEVSAAVLDSLTIEPATVIKLPAGLYGPFKAIAAFSDNYTGDATNYVDWSSSDTAVATVSNSDGSKGLVTGIKVGTATITATDTSSVPSISATRDVQVTDAVFQSITVYPEEPEDMPAGYGFMQQFYATADLSDGSKYDATERVNWLSTDPNVATASNSIGSKGLVTALEVGETTIQASYSDKKGDRGLIVNNSTVASLRILPTTPDSIEVGRSQDLYGWAIFTNGKEFNLSERLTWQASDDGINPTDSAIISIIVVDAKTADEDGGKAQVKGKAAGTAYVRVVDGVTSKTSPWITVTVTSSVSNPLKMVEIQPGTPSVKKETGLKFYLIGTYEDLTRVRFTSMANWTSSDPNIALVSNEGIYKGACYAVSAGSVTITATDPISDMSTFVTFTVMD